MASNWFGLNSSIWKVSLRVLYMVVFNSSLLKTCSDGVFEKVIIADWSVYFKKIDQSTKKNGKQFTISP